MTEYSELTTLEVDTPVPEVTPAQELIVPTPGTPANGQPGPELPPKPTNRHALAGRKGAERVHQLIERGKLYEQEHDLKRGRQRLRQLIEEGKLYEQEHGLSQRRRKRDAHVTHEQLLRRLVESLVRVAKPSYRPLLLKLVQALEVE